jgi:hypothetical protein
MFDDDVHAALLSATPEAPATLIDILNAVDARQHLVLTLEELNAALEALVTSGRAQQVTPAEFASGEGSRAFTPVTFAHYEAAVRRYTEPLPPPSIHDDAGDDVEAMVVLHVETQGNPPSESELDEFADALDAELGESADILGFEMGNDVIELLVAVESDHDPNEVVTTVTTVASEFSAKLGKWSVIVR